ncbi:MAG: hypothetical protein RL536_642 [Candidatus Parcubacteria bacterium]|jgi:hypothetical protein
MIGIQYHISFEKDVAALKRRFAKFEEALGIFERLCQEQFHPTQAKQVIAPAKIHRISQNDSYTLWKTELVVPKSGIRPNQYPRMWFAVKGAIVVFLCIATHIDNYNDDDMNRLAASRVTDFF